MSEKPLHVRVAEVLGWLDIHQRGTPGCCGDILLPGIRWAGRKPGNVLVGREGRHDDLPDYDTDWSATGPIVERLNITLFRDFGMYDQTKPWTNNWRAMYRAADDLQFGAAMEAKAPTPLAAACSLILALHAAGKV